MSTSKPRIRALLNKLADGKLPRSSNTDIADILKRAFSLGALDQGAVAEELNCEPRHIARVADGLGSREATQLLRSLGFGSDK